jgi:hypothetical protein
VITRSFRSSRYVLSVCIGRPRLMHENGSVKVPFARGGGIGRRAGKEASRFSRVFFLELPDHLVSAKAC